MIPTTTLLLSALALAGQANAATYNLLTSHKGSTFFQGFNFLGGYDNTTNGDVFWVNNSSLAYVTPQNTAIIKVDNTTFVPYNEKRNSVKLLSQQWYKPGTVMVMDALHLPYGCSVWPAWWTQGLSWPNNGEIDILETVNLGTIDQYALHSLPGCTASQDPTYATATGTSAIKDCDQSLNYGSGCTVQEGKANSAGAGFASAGGGVYVMAFETNGINIWFFTRSSVPAALTSTASTIDTKALGAPSASYGNSTCPITSRFGSQQMILDITLCGDFAGTPSILEATCPTLAVNQTCYTTYVINNGSYANAYFEINYINVFGTSSSVDTTIAGSTISGSSTTTGTGAATGTGTTGAGGASAAATSKVSAGEKVVGMKGVGGVVAVVLGLVGGAGWALL